MEYTIKSNDLEVRISSRGAELQSIRSVDGNEYLWQGDPAFWKSRAINLFPYIGRLTNGTFIFEGNEYQMRHHGFLCEQELQVVESTEDSVCFRLQSNEVTRQWYPFEFAYSLAYRLIDREVQITAKVENLGEKEMYFGLGGHPGFQIPLGGEGQFEDCYLEFPTESQPIRVGISTTGYVNGEDEAYVLREGKYLDLRHDLFDRDAIVLRDMPKQVTIRSKVCDRSICVKYPQMDYLGIWHTVKKPAPFLCIEPWTSLPSREGIVEDLAEQENLVCLQAGTVYENSWSVLIK